MFWLIALRSSMVPELEVARSAVASCPDRLARSRPRDKVRLADAQTDHVIHGGGDVEELANAGRRLSRLPVRQMRRHGWSYECMTVLSSLMLMLPATPLHRGPLADR